ncbi:hypothetical protein B4119_0533 [Parageobacillus caldoxylosilyticus]|uniref:Uncharacterized protein n=1 Tax=Saccharococcus caldoxylosilyticus TaxID=81408 RepID=A0A150LX51_9BACL|nr:hypothetical protein B4119_0533 [Parageobacillus caldoxylosilyticus]
MLFRELARDQEVPARSVVADVACLEQVRVFPFPEVPLFHTD